MPHIARLWGRSMGILLPRWVQKLIVTLPLSCRAILDRVMLRVGNVPHAHSYKMMLRAKFYQVLVMALAWKWQYFKYQTPTELSRLAGWLFRPMPGRQAICILYNDVILTSQCWYPSDTIKHYRITTISHRLMHVTLNRLHWIHNVTLSWLAASEVVVLTTCFCRKWRKIHIPHFISSLQRLHLLLGALPIGYIDSPAGTRRKTNVIISSKRRRDVVLT